MSSNSFVSIFRSFLAWARAWAGRLVMLLALAFPSVACRAQTDHELTERVQQLTEAMNRIETQITESQRQLDQMRKQLADLLERLDAGKDHAPAQTAEAAARLQAQVDDLRERQSVQESRVAVQEQAKVESESKYPVKISGLILFNGYVNTRMVDAAPTPTVAVAGPASTGATMRQTILGLDARGPHLLGARSHGDLRIDFDGSVSESSGYSGGYGANLVRLRTAHGVLEWDRARAFIAFDRPILSPNSPDSLTAVAEPPLAWSGNLWFWNPQIGGGYDLPVTNAWKLRVQSALIDAADAPNTRIPTTTNGVPIVPSTAQLSRWPGVETRLALAGGGGEPGIEVGVGGYFASHRTLSGRGFDSWAGTVDYHVPLPAGMELSGAAYRGLALGGLGGGAFKDYVFHLQGKEVYIPSLDDIGGWTQWKQRVGERLEFNGALGIDNIFAGQLRPYVGSTADSYQLLARNRTITGNVIYSPSAYLDFSVEYRRIESSPVNAHTNASDVIGLAAGYKF